MNGEMIRKMDQLWEVSVTEAEQVKKLRVLMPPSGTGGTTLAKWFTEQIDKANHGIDQAETKAHLTCVCHKGCDACCKQAIQVLPAEAKAISAFMARFSAAEKQQLQIKINDWLKVISESGLDTEQNHYYKKGAPEEALYTFMSDYFKLGLKCPMLSDEGACMIYPVRPGGCWSYRVYEAPETCEAHFENPAGMKHDAWERNLLDSLYTKVKPEHTMKLLPYYIDDILKHRI